MRYFGPISESRMKIVVLLLVVISGCCAEENLLGASFLFSKTTNTDRVILKPIITEPLRSITVCLQSYTDLTQRDSLFKLQNQNVFPFHLYQVSNIYNIKIDRDQVSFRNSGESMELRLICVSWESSNGVIHFVVNGKLFPRKVLKPGFSIVPGFTAVLGHNLAVSDAGFGVGGPSYVGEITNVHMWDQALHPSEMQSMYFNNCRNCSGNVINWESVDYKIYGDILLYRPSMKP
ncbi:C-reactive protein-like [Bufo bufo]|uniref:C-reactive protein-like n=1 Tax=Bufo bufo TaxID=8384 RepID=UPI001ABE9432|nr:C-reactive protein-like [Bufo bufo]